MPKIEGVPPELQKELEKLFEQDLAVMQQIQQQQLQQIQRMQQLQQQQQPNFQRGNVPNQGSGMKWGERG